jgi:hypothetical protein
MLHWWRAPSSTVTTSAPSTSPPTPFSTSAQSMSRSTPTLCGNTWPSVMSASCMCRRHPIHRHLYEGSTYFSVFGVLVQSQHSQWLEFWLGGGVRNMMYYRYMGSGPPLMWGLARPIRGSSRVGGTLAPPPRAVWPCHQAIRPPALTQPLPRVTDEHSYKYVPMLCNTII